MREKLKKISGSGLQESNHEARGLDMILLEKIKHRGCPICMSNASHDKEYFSWFPIEVYHEPGFLKQVEASFGFCKRHGAFLDTQSKLAPQISFVHAFIADATYNKLALYLSSFAEKNNFPHNDKDSDNILPDPEMCPVCASSKTSSDRMLWFFNKLLHNGSAFSDYGNPGLLCFHHLQILAKTSDSAIIQRLIPFHDSAVSRTLKKMENPDSSQILAGIDNDLCRKGIELSIGSLYEDKDRIFLNRMYNKKPDMDPMADFIDSLENTDCCPVCRYENTALSRWINWINEKIELNTNLEPMSGVLPSCPDHVRAFVHLGSPALQFAAVYNSLKTLHTNILIAKKQSDILKKRKDMSLWKKFKGEKGNTDTMDIGKKADVCGALASSVRCPVCENMKTTEKRAIDLLFALLRESQYRKSFEKGYGLCMKHFIVSSKFAPSGEIKKFLTEVQCAKLALLKWELDEIMRKMAWDTRPEPDGSEKSAWHRGIARFSGLSEDRA